MTEEEKEEAQRIKDALYVLMKSDSGARFRGWFSYSGKWIGQYEGGPWVWVKGGESDFGLGQ